MGREVRCVARFGKDESEGHALLETNELLFRGEFRLKVPLSEIRSLEMRGDTLRIETTGGRLELDLGAAEAAKWVRALREPKSLADKLGLKEGQKVAFVGLADRDFAAQVKDRTGAAPAKSARGADLVFFVVDAKEDLERLAALAEAMKPDGALWVLRPKGRRDLTEADVREAGRGAGLVDVKVVAYSASLTAEKFVVPRARRPK